MNRSFLVICFLITIFKINIPEGIICEAKIWSFSTAWYFRYLKKNLYPALGLVWPTKNTKTCKVLEDSDLVLYNSSGMICFVWFKLRRSYGIIATGWIDSSEWDGQVDTGGHIDSWAALNCISCCSLFFVLTLSLASCSTLRKTSLLSIVCLKKISKPGEGLIPVCKKFKCACKTWLLVQCKDMFEITTFQGKVTNLKRTHHPSYDTLRTKKKTKSANWNILLGKSHESISKFRWGKQGMC